MHEGGLKHPCVAPALWGALLGTAALLLTTLLIGYCCRVHGVQRRRKHMSEQEARHDYEEFWFSRLESAVRSFFFFLVGFVVVTASEQGTGGAHSCCHAHLYRVCSSL